MDAIANGAIAYVASVATVFGLYPYRDFVKISNVRDMPSINVKHFCVDRYRGMATNPTQPMLLAAPPGLLYLGYVLGAGGFTSAILGGFFFGISKMSVATVARRMGGKSRYDRLSHKSYTSLIDCVKESRRQYGLLSFFSGGVAASMIAILWHGTSLAVLQQGFHRSFLGDCWDAFRIHALLALLTTPIRNGFRSALSSAERSGGVPGIREFVAGEVAVFSEASGVFRHAARSKGLPFFLHGVIRTTFKTSVPFAITYGLFKALGGSLGHPSGGRGGHGGNHTGRHCSRRFS